MKNKKHSTADLVIGHAQKHLDCLENCAGDSIEEQDTRGTLFFGFAGVVVMLVAFFLVNSTGNDSTFVAENATDYLAQQNFYSGEEMHAAADSFAVREKVHAAAVATELSRSLNFIGFILVLVGFWYLHSRHDVFRLGKVRFRIRRIK